jgi:hypothetical protein
MSTLSQFFGAGGGGFNGIGLSTGSAFELVTSTKNVAIPSNVKYVAYAVMGQGGDACNRIIGDSPEYPGCGTRCSGGGGGFSYREGAISCGSPFNACVIIGASTSITNLCNPSSGVTAICATRGCFNGGTGYLGLINTSGGNGICTCGGPSASNVGVNWGGGGAGGIYGNGGNGTCNGGGGGFGSGGGGGSLGCGGGFGSPSQSTAGGNGLAGRGASGAPGCNALAAEPGFIVQFTRCGQYSQGKTFFAAAGGGGSNYAPAAAGGGGGSWPTSFPQSSGGFGGGSGSGRGPAVPAGLALSCSTEQNNFGGGAGAASAFSCPSCASGGAAIAMIEWW